MLILFQFEQCPFCVKVREKLTELQLDFVGVNVLKGTEKRSIVQKIGGQDRVPLLIDTDRAELMYESGDILAYLDENYGK